MTIKERCKGDGFSPLTFMAGFFETIAVVLFLALVVDLLGGSPEDQVPVFELIGLLVLFAWLMKKINNILSVVDVNLDKSMHWLTHILKPGSSAQKPIEIKGLSKWWQRSFWITSGIIPIVALPAVVIFAMYSLAEGSPVTATVWKWTYLCAVSIMAICLAWMLGMAFLVRRQGCKKDGG